MYPGSELNLDLIRTLIQKAYCPIYGDMRILEEIDLLDDDKCLSGSVNGTSLDKSCPQTSGSYFSLILLVVYVVIANVLLLNLLIAMFR
jgi:hypothetical protein